MDWLAESRSETSTLPFAAIYVIHDDGLDWALTTQLMVELLMSNGGRLGTSRTDVEGMTQDPPPIPVFFTNPDLIWST